jgi:primosomal protein N'
MMTGRTARTGRYTAARAAAHEPTTGTVVRVTFGNRESTGTVVGTTITGRYSVKLDIPGADEPVTASFTREQIHLPAS